MYGVGVYGHVCEHMVFSSRTGSILRAILPNAITVIFEYIIEMALYQWILLDTHSYLSAFK